MTGYQSKKKAALDEEGMYFVHHTQPAQEPVAWLCTPDEDGLFGLPLADKGCKDCFPVYTTPPQKHT